MKISFVNKTVAAMERYLPCFVATLLCSYELNQNYESPSPEHCHYQDKAKTRLAVFYLASYLLIEYHYFLNFLEKIYQ